MTLSAGTKKALPIRFRHWDSSCGVVFLSEVHSLHIATSLRVDNDRLRFAGFLILTAQCNNQNALQCKVYDINQSGHWSVRPQNSNVRMEIKMEQSKMAVVLSRHNKEKLLTQTFSAMVRQIFIWFYLLENSLLSHWNCVCQVKKGTSLASLENWHFTRGRCALWENASISRQL